MPVKIAQQKLMNQLIRSPHLVLEKLDLVYVSNQKLPIERLQEKDGFVYKKNGRYIKQKSELKRFSSLVLPPAWENVRISDLANGHLQAVGLDVKNRKQYRYHPKWNQIRNQTKFYKIAEFGQKLPAIRKQVDQDLEEKEWSKNKVIALVIRLMEGTHIRIGNEKYAKDNKSYGLSTLRKRHININKNSLRFEFIGKKGKQHTITTRNKQLIKLVSRCEEIPGWEVFKYYDNNGERKVLDSHMVNEYLHQISGEYFSAKDFRTWAASILFFENLMEIGISSDEKEIKKNILTAYDATAEALGNTRNVCKNYYVHPLLVSTYEDGSIQQYFDQVKKSRSTKKYFSRSESAFAELITKYQVSLV
ncbi:DNA topoisomerase-1 [Flavobacterium resistens]|uniref:DNA topoisomerase n=1 Tax=Flavobacterium resistens TaxID=443612 RepID=A0A521AXC2_9FLAO|nr:DNA topoisomerase IB [Flavobacterium resistens]MRX68477.1 DNA topoisomerase IB [Flavobacterium resistens]SMO39503.1 DNA topoisomerase-1 [Flavobacterium resistens]